MQMTFCESVVVVFVTDRHKCLKILDNISVSVKNCQRFEPSLIVLKCSEYAYTTNARFSTYKNHTTVKCLVAIAPGGWFTFVSASVLVKLTIGKWY